MNEPDFETTLDRFDDLYLLDFDKELINTSQLQEATPYVQVATVFKHVSLLPKIDSLLTELESK
jgi:hypothetical protein